MAPDTPVSLTYPDGQPVLVGDGIVIDGVRGIVRQVILPRTDDADSFSCLDTGGLLYETELYGLMLIPFGSSEGLVERAED